MTALAGWQNPRWSEITDPIFRHIFQSLEEWTRNPTVSTISTPRTSAGNEPTYNAVTDRVDQPSPVTLFGNQLIEGEIQSANFVAGTSGWRIRNNGDAEFNSVTVRGDLKAGTVAAGPLAGLPRFEAVAAGTTTREGSLTIDNTSSASGIIFRHATAGPTYSTAGSMAGVSAGLSINAGSTKSLFLFGGGTDLIEMILETAQLRLIAHTNNKLRVEHSTERGAMVGSLDSGSGKVTWIETGSFTGTTAAGDILSVSFGATFPGNPSVIVSNGSSAFGPAEVFSLASVSTTGFTVRCFGSGAGATRVVNWVATYVA